MEHANRLREQGKKKLEAVFEAPGTHLRPILMTSAATDVRYLPLVFATGPGAGPRNSNDIVLVTGMIIGTSAPGAEATSEVPESATAVSRTDTATVQDCTDDQVRPTENGGTTVAVSFLLSAHRAHPNPVCPGIPGH